MTHTSLSAPTAKAESTPQELEPTAASPLAASSSSTLTSFPLAVCLLLPSQADTAADPVPHPCWSDLSYFPLAGQKLEELLQPWSPLQTKAIVQR